MTLLAASLCEQSLYPYDKVLGWLHSGVHTVARYQWPTGVFRRRVVVLRISERSIRDTYVRHSSES